MLPSSLMLLNTAHEYLGRRSLCCNSEGALLKFYVSVWIPSADSVRCRVCVRGLKRAALLEVCAHVAPQLTELMLTAPVYSAVRADGDMLPPVVLQLIL